MKLKDVMEAEGLARELSGAKKAMEYLQSESQNQFLSVEVNLTHVWSAELDELEWPLTSDERHQIGEIFLTAAKRKVADLEKRLREMGVDLSD